MRTLHVGLRLADLDRSIAFYVAVGYEVLGKVHPSESATPTMLKLTVDEFVSLELVGDRDHPHVDPADFSHLVINVRDLDHTIAVLAERGVETEAPTSPDGLHQLWTAWVTDPDGYRIELVQWPPGHPPGMTRADLEPPAYEGR